MKISVDEKEKKYTIEAINKTDLWEREQIVYQWYIHKIKNKSTKIKIIFDLTRAKIICVSVTKEFVDWGKSIKQISYLDVNNFNANDYINCKFVLKRRSIKDKIFIDRFIRSNGKTDYLIEDENNHDVGELQQWFSGLRDVTDNQEYYNENMCSMFTEKDAEYLAFILDAFRIY